MQKASWPLKSNWERETKKLTAIGNRNKCKWKSTIKMSYWGRSCSMLWFLRSKTNWDKLQKWVKQIITNHTMTWNHSRVKRRKLKSIASRISQKNQKNHILSPPLATSWCPQHRCHTTKKKCYPTSHKQTICFTINWSPWKVKLCHALTSKLTSNASRNSKTNSKSHRLKKEIMLVASLKEEIWRLAFHISIMRGIPAFNLKINKN